MIMHEGRIVVLGDIAGVTGWEIRAVDADIEDPPVYSSDVPDDISHPSFSKFVAAMIINDILFADGNYVELKPQAARSALIPLNLSTDESLFADGPLESATVLVFDYHGDGPVCAKARAPAGNALLQQLRIEDRV
jgi:hypothetical protein